MHVDLRPRVEHFGDGALRKLHERPIRVFPDVSDDFALVEHGFEDPFHPPALHLFQQNFGAGPAGDAVFLREVLVTRLFRLDRPDLHFDRRCRPQRRPTLPDEL